MQNTWKFARSMTATIALATALVASGSAMANADTVARPATQLTAMATNGEMHLTGTVKDHAAVPADVTYTFSHSTSMKIYSVAKSGGVAGLATLCATLPIPPPFRAVSCAVLASVLIEAITHPIGDHDCYQIFLKLGIPPAGVRVVKCPDTVRNGDSNTMFSKS